MKTIWKDIRFGVRMLVKNPVFSAAAVLSMGLGIGLNTAIFSVVYTVLLRPLPYGEPDTLVMIWQTPPKQQGKRLYTSVPDYYIWKEQKEIFQDVAVVHASVPVNLTSEDNPERVDSQPVSATLFDVLGVPPQLGRTFRSGEDERGAALVTMISDRLWRRRFGADPNIVGKTLPIDGQNHQIVGVMPPGFQFLNPDADLWTPIPFNDTVRRVRNVRWLHAVGRLRPGVTLQQAQARMSTLAQQISEQFPETNDGWGVWLEPVHEATAGPLRVRLLVLLGAVGFVLLIACTNVANLLIAKAASRRTEFALRTALGAGRMRLIRQSLTESLLLALAGGVLGLLLAAATIEPLVLLAPANITRLNEVSLDQNVLGFTLLLVLGTGLLFGILPALLGSQPELNTSLRQGAREGRVSRGGRRIRHFLVVTQVALALVLLVGAGLMMNSFLRLQGVDPGFDPAKRLTFQVKLSPAQYREDLEGLTDGTELARINPRRTVFFQSVLDRLKELPGIEAAAAITWLPLNNYWVESRYLTIEGQPLPAPGEEPNWAIYNSVSWELLDTLKIPLLRGRHFTASDSASAPWVVIINQAMAKKHWPQEDPLGRHLTILMEPEERPREIVGVVGDVRYLALNIDPYPAIYVLFSQQPSLSPGNRVRSRLHMSYVIRTQSDPALLMNAVRRKVAELDPSLPIYAVKTMEEYLSDVVSEPRFYLWLMGPFGATALVLAAVGIYGVMAYSVTQRSHEIGVRMALGAQRPDVLKMVVRQGVLLTLGGLILGLAAAAGLTRLLETQLYEVSPTDPFTFGFIAFVLMAVAVAACYIPAQRAAKVNPVQALRHE